MSELTGWALLHSKLPPQALKPLPQATYGVAGLTDVNEGFLIQRLFASKLAWQWRLVTSHYLGFEDRQPQGKEYTTRWYLADAHGILEIDGREFHGAGAHDNRKLDAAYKGAATVAFKNACKLAGLTIELFKDGKAMDFIYEDSSEKNAPRVNGSDDKGAGAVPPKHPEADSGAQSSAPASETDLESLYKLGAELPRTPKTRPQVDGMIDGHGYDKVLKSLTNQHQLQCGSGCPHLGTAK